VCRNAVELAVDDMCRGGC